MSNSIPSLVRTATALLLPLTHGTPEAITAALKPQDSDYEAAFVGESAALARAGYAPMWSAPPRGLAKPEQTNVLINGCFASAFATDNVDSRQFPGAYRPIAHRLVPTLPWLRFVFVAPGQTSGMAYDGLVWIGDHWAWFPKPWRHIDLSS